MYINDFDKSIVRMDQQKHIIEFSLPDNWFWILVVLLVLLVAFRKLLIDVFYLSLSTKWLLKLGHDLDAYFKKEEEYRKIKERLCQCARNPEQHKNAEIQNLLNDLRASPFFDNKYRLEYDNLWQIVKGQESSLACEEVIY